MPARAPGPHVRYLKGPRWRRAGGGGGRRFAVSLVPVVPGSCVLLSERPPARWRAVILEG